MAVLEVGVVPHGGGLLGMTMDRYWLHRTHPAYWWVWTVEGVVVSSTYDRPTKLRF